MMRARFMFGLGLFRIGLNLWPRRAGWWLTFLEVALMGQLPKEIEDAWDLAFANPGTAIPVGRAVVCDWCDKDFTDSAETGGFIFESKATCPCCAARLETGAKKHGEERFIRARCPGGKSFADFVREYRGQDATITVG